MPRPDHSAPDSLTGRSLFDLPDALIASIQLMASGPGEEDLDSAEADGELARGGAGVRGNA
eukprot:CAMPEP_0180163782 /NCGR_PEP_ID=MMETSP0986-20121125/29994_1 /TAXON_ID=697907 /ORGANISM="non described non described, Strain CCMP2293" /LENGTH=60 /DNA_ID=CAMNT_0022114463 /DNA_START=105 /DNA_END=284 /DNA_ORIENTATION=-